MKNIVTVCTDYTSGGTFFSWTLEYLTGKDEYWCWAATMQASEPKFIKLTDNPLTKLNAHGFESNEFGKHCAPAYRVGDTTRFLDLLDLHPTHVYIQNPESEKVREIQDRSKAVFRLVNDSIYHQSYINRHHDTEIYTDEELLMNYLTAYFLNSMNKWGNISSDYYNRRELLSLIVTPHDNSRYGPYESFDSTKPHMLIHAHDMYHYFDITIFDCFKYAGLTIDPIRFEKWLLVWHQWRKIHKSRFLFQSYLDKIVEYTVSGYDMDLTRFNLDIIQQAVIMHELNRKHGLTIAGYGVKEFTSTAQLHALLEPSIHGNKNEQT